MHVFASGGSGGIQDVQLKDGKRRVLVDIRVGAGSDIDALGVSFPNDKGNYVTRLCILANRADSHPDPRTF
jgi:hypothetical protein